MDVTKLSTNTRRHQDSRVRVTRDQWRSGKVDCEAKLRGAAGGCRWSGWPKVLSDGPWVGLSHVVSSLPPIFLNNIHLHLRRPQYSGLFPLRPNTILAEIPLSMPPFDPFCTLASLAKQLNRLLQSVTVPPSSTRQPALLFRSRLGTKIARVYSARSRPSRHVLPAVPFSSERAESPHLPMPHAENEHDIFRQLLLGRLGLQRVTKTVLQLTNCPKTPKRPWTKVRSHPNTLPLCVRPPIIV